jgi:hypothetical protein
MEDGAKPSTVVVAANSNTLIAERVEMDNMVFLLSVGGADKLTKGIL